MVKNNKKKKGWIRIVEVFVAILLITGVLMVVINKGYLKKSNLSYDAYNSESYILQDVEMNETLRTAILGTTGEIIWSNFESNGLGAVVDVINSEIPNYLNCNGQICGLNETCILPESVNSTGDVYASSIVIAANFDTYNPRQLKLFCWGR